MVKYEDELFINVKFDMFVIINMIIIMKDDYKVIVIEDDKDVDISNIEVFVILLIFDIDNGVFIVFKVIDFVWWLDKDIGKYFKVVILFINYIFEKDDLVFYYVYVMNNLVENVVLEKMVDELLVGFFIIMEGLLEW